MIVLDIINNLSLLVALSVVSGFIGDHWRYRFTGKIMQGFLFGLITVIGMLRPLVLSPGLIFDGRSVILSLAALFYGPIAVLPAIIMAGLCRIIIGGSGTLTGLLVMSSSALIGLLFYFRYTRREADISPFVLLVMGLLVHIAMVSLMLTLPGRDRVNVFKTISVPVMTIYPLATILIGRIISERVRHLRSLEALRSSEEKFRGYINNSPDGVFLADEKGRYLEVNPAASKITGYSREELLSKKIPDLIPPQAIEEGFRSFKELQKEGASRTEGEYLHKSGEIRWWSVFAVKMSEERFLGFVRDITEIKQVEKQVSSLLKEKEILLKETHHRVKNFLGTMNSLLEVQASTYRSEQCKTLLSESARRVRGMTVLYERLYSSEHKSGLKAILFFEPLVREIIESISCFPVTISVQVDDLLLPPKLLSPLGIMLNEMISNSVKYAFANDRENTLSLQVAGAGEMITLRYRDNGPGIAETLMRQGGDGFGLKLVHLLCGQIGASLVMENDDGLLVTVIFKAA